MAHATPSGGTEVSDIAAASTVGHVHEESVIVTEGLAVATGSLGGQGDTSLEQVGCRPG